MAFTEKAKESLDKVIKKFEEGDIAPIVKIALLHRTEEVPFDKWSFSNKILAYLQTGSLDCRGYKQWQAVGRQVKKGASSAYILAPRMKTIEEENKEGKKEKKRICVGFLSISVFGLEQTEGEPVDYGYGEIKPPNLLDVAEEFGLLIRYNDLVGAYGATNTRNGDIQLATEDESVFFHEFAHAVRVKTGLLKADTKEGYAREEVIAQFTATVLAEMYGKDITGHTERYIERYTGEKALKSITSVLGEVEQVLDEIAKVKERIMA
jgi:antirestriction protein ArdC